MRSIVAFQGEAGAFSEAAAGKLVGGDMTLLPSPTFDAAVRAVVNGHADYAVIPVANAIAGPVYAALDAMAPFASIERVRELSMPIHLALLGVVGATAEGVREVLSHPMALKQCTKFLAARPEVRAVEASDTAGAARLVAIRREPSVAAIAARWAAERYGLMVLAEHLEDTTDNVTTFALIRRRPA